MVIHSLVEKGHNPLIQPPRHKDTKDPHDDPAPQALKKEINYRVRREHRGIPVYLCALCSLNKIYKCLRRVEENLVSLWLKAGIGTISGWNHLPMIHGVVFGLSARDFRGITRTSKK